MVNQNIAIVQELIRSLSWVQIFVSSSPEFCFNFFNSLHAINYKLYSFSSSSMLSLEEIILFANRFTNFFANIGKILLVSKTTTADDKLGRNAKI